MRPGTKYYLFSEALSNTRAIDALLGGLGFLIKETSKMGYIADLLLT